MNSSALRTFLSGRTVIVTGHSGFKGSWLTLWLSSLGANVVGISLPPDQAPEALFNSAKIADVCRSEWLDIREFGKLIDVFRAVRPQIVFHLAAQALVYRAYRDPLETFAINVLGTANVLEAARLTNEVKSLVCITTDKVYDNREWPWPYRETDALGGQDPYSASKSAAEMVARSYMTGLRRPDGPLPMATARGGNVIGGGDWSEHRIIPDIIRSIRRKEKLILRRPHATRPWQHVLEICFGYLLLAMCLELGRPELGIPAAEFRGAWNFGPDPASEISVEVLVRCMLNHMDEQETPVEIEQSSLHEATYLRLDSSKAKRLLGWNPLLSFADTMAWTTSWYRGHGDDPCAARQLAENQIRQFERLIDNYFRA